MFLCKPCLDHRMEDAKVPPDRTVPFIPASWGKCEDCGQPADCADPPSSWLPVPSRKFKVRRAHA